MKIFIVHCWDTDDWSSIVIWAFDSLLKAKIRYNQSISYEILSLWLHDWDCDNDRDSYTVWCLLESWDIWDWNGIYYWEYHTELETDYRKITYYITEETI